jgi:hypothetical protein
MIVVFGLADGKIAQKKWTNADFLGLMQQMKVFPAPGRQPSETHS